MEANYTSRIGARGARFGISVRDIAARDIAAQAAALGWLDLLRAPISGDLRGSIGEDGSPGPVSASLRIGAGAVQPVEAVRPIPFEGARSYFTYDPADQVLRFDELSIDSAWGRGVAEGQAELIGVETGRLQALIGQVTLNGLQIDPPGLFGAPMRPGRAQADFRLDLDPFRLRLGQMTLAELGGGVHLSGALEARADGWALALDGQAGAITRDRLVELWPAALAPKPRAWVAENLLEGTLRDIDFSARLMPGQEPALHADFAYSETVIRYHRALPPITGAAGQTSFFNRRLVTTLSAGQVSADEGGVLDVAGSSFIIPDTAIKRAAPGIARITAEGPVTAILSVLNRPPISVLKGTPLPIDLAQGRARVAGTLSLPLKKGAQFPDFRFHFTGEIRDAQSAVLVPGHLLSAARLSLRGDHSGVEIAGDARIDALPVSLRWRQPLGVGVGRASRVEGRVELSPRLVETFDIGLPPGSVSGRGAADFTLDLAPGTAPALFSSSVAGDAA